MVREDSEGCKRKMAVLVRMMGLPIDLLEGGSKQEMIIETMMARWAMVAMVAMDDGDG